MDRIRAAWIPLGSFSIALLLAAISAQPLTGAWLLRRPAQQTEPGKVKITDLQIKVPVRGGIVVTVTGKVSTIPKKLKAEEKFAFEFFNAQGQSIGTPDPVTKEVTTENGVIVVQETFTFPKLGGISGAKLKYTVTAKDPAGNSDEGLATFGTISNPPTLAQPAQTPLTVATTLEVTFKKQAQQAQYDWIAIVTGGTVPITAKILVKAEFFFENAPDADYDDTLFFTETNSKGGFKLVGQVIPANGAPDGVKVSVTILATDAEGKAGFDSKSGTDGFTRP